MNLIGGFQFAFSVQRGGQFPHIGRDGGRGAVRGLGAHRDGAVVLGHRLQPPHRGHIETGGK